MGVDRAWIVDLIAPILTFPRRGGKGLYVTQRSPFAGTTEVGISGSSV